MLCEVGGGQEDLATEETGGQTQADRESFSQVRPQWRRLSELGGISSDWPRAGDG